MGARDHRPAPLSRQVHQEDRQAQLLPTWRTLQGFPQDFRCPQAANPQPLRKTHSLRSIFPQQVRHRNHDPQDTPRLHQLLPQRTPVLRGRESPWRISYASSQKLQAHHEPHSVVNSLRPCSTKAASSTSTARNSSQSSATSTQHDSTPPTSAHSATTAPAARRKTTPASSSPSSSKTPPSERLQQNLNRNPTELQHDSTESRRVQQNPTRPTRNRRKPVGYFC